MKTTFNLNKFEKKAYYDDGRGQVQKMSRSFMNCFKSKMDGQKTASAHKAWMSCLDEYQDSKYNDWGTKYAANDSKTAQG